ncbi:membrane protein insertion efficiency factor YidD [Bdellovibrio sp. HCB290]|uniref:membrane protein insertion efficiency factor YidD n=1 Tax=Bdellovibrio sp. HCB290 TaxID=3394356 RepID=UPI0039B3C36A
MRNLLKLWTAGLGIFEKTFKASLWFFVAAYRSIGTTHLGGSCRFEPSCSAYALEAIHKHKSHKAFWLITKRICKCRPGGPYGYDPVPDSGESLHDTAK